MIKFILSLLLIASVCSQASGNYFSCPNNCNNNGYCQYGICQCYMGYSGSDCSQSIYTQEPTQTPTNFCPNNCSNQGYCFNGQCYCSNGYYGPDCSQNQYTQQPSPTPTNFCPNNCSNQGFCYNDRCYCSNGYYGPDCSQNQYTQQPTPTPTPCDCSGHGSCSYGQCYCYSGYFGDKCQFSKNDKIYCEFTDSVVKVSSPTNITCTISGNGKCTDLVGQSECKSNGGYWGGSTECKVFQSYFRNSIECSGSQITCRSSFAVCSNNYGNYLVNGDDIGTDNKLIEVENSGDNSSSSSSTLSILSSLLFIGLLINVLL